MPIMGALPLLLALAILLLRAAGASFPPDGSGEYDPPPPCRCANRSQTDCATGILKADKALWSWAAGVPADGDKAERCVSVCDKSFGRSKYVRFGLAHDECDRQYDVEFDRCLAKQVASGKYGCWSKEDMAGDSDYPPMDEDDYPPGDPIDYPPSGEWSDEDWSGGLGRPYDPCEVYWESAPGGDYDGMYDSMRTVDEYEAALCRAERRTVLAYEKCVERCYEHAYGSGEDYYPHDEYDEDPVVKACGCEPNMDSSECYKALPETSVCDCLAETYSDLKCTAADGGGGAQGEGAQVAGRRGHGAGGGKHRRPVRHRRRR